MATRLPKKFEDQFQLLEEKRREWGAERDTVAYMAGTLEHWVKMVDLYSQVLQHSYGLQWDMAWDAHKYAETKVSETREWFRLYGPPTEVSK